jgi:ABC-type Fe3+ transport system substrate-binding protein
MFMNRAGYASLAAVVALLAACGGSAAPATSSAPGAVSQAASAKPSAAAQAAAAKPSAAASAAASAGAASWDQLVAAAKQEGEVTVATTASAPKAIFDGFKAKYGIQVNVLGQSAGTLIPKIKTERAAEQYLEDVSINSTNTTITGFKGIGGLDPLPPALILPEVTDDKSWIGGFADGWADTGKNLDYSTQRLAEPIIHVNRKVIPESQLSHIEQLWDPAWKGKIVMGDTRVPTTATPMLAAWIQLFGEDKVRTFLQTQQPVISNQPRQIAEWLVRGQYPIAFGVGVTDMTLFASQGLDLSHVKPLSPDEPGGVVGDDGTGSVALFNRAPHPNAAKVLINWFMGPEGQTAASKLTGYNSRRSDVKPADPNTVIDPNKKYSRVQTEDSYPLFQKALEISKELLK